MASFTKEVNPRLAKRPQVFLTTGLQAYPLKLIYRFASVEINPIYDRILQGITRKLHTW